MMDQHKSFAFENGRTCCQITVQTSALRNMVQKCTAGQRFDQNEQQALGVPLPCICQHHLDNRIQFLKAIIYIHIFSLAWQCAQFFRGAHFCKIRAKFKFVILSSLCCLVYVQSVIDLFSKQLNNALNVH